MTGIVDRRAKTITAGEEVDDTIDDEVGGCHDGVQFEVVNRSRRAGMQAKNNVILSFPSSFRCVYEDLLLLPKMVGYMRS